MKRHLLSLLKIGIPLAILAYLLWDAKNDDAFGALRQQYTQFGFRWGLLGAAWACCGAAVLTTLLRWYLLIRALNISVRLGDCLRLGFLGYLFNLAPMGIVGGDLLKAVMLARRQRHRHAQAFATVAVDRVIGLYMLFVVASVAILLAGFHRHEMRNIRLICWGTLALTALATAVIAVPFVRGMGRRDLPEKLGRIRYLGPPLEHLVEAMQMYRRRFHVLAVAAAMSAAVHTLFTTGIYLITLGLYQEVHKLSLDWEFIVAPLSASTGVIPLVMGPFEVVLTFLYETVFEFTEGQGLVVALAYRLITVLIAAVGVCYYVGSRREVAEVIHQAQQEQQAGHQPQGQTA